MPATPSQILHVDDNPASHLAVQTALEGLPDRVVCVDSGKKALRRLLDEEFSLILLDVNMPEMDGFEVADQIKRIERLRHIPIIFLSAVRQEDAEVFRGYSAGAVDYLFTPVKPSLLRAKAASFLLLQQLNIAVREQAAELLSANAQLRTEIAERQRAETAMRQAQAALEARNHEIQRATQQKSAFLASMSHEVRTPLNAIIGFAELLIDGKAGPLSAKQTEFLADVHRGGRDLLALINNVLDLARVEAGRLELQPERFSLPGAIAEVCGVVQSLALKKELTVQVSVAPALQEVELDLPKFKQVLYNLLSNALKFTDRGSVNIAAQPLDARRFALTVQDTGLGIARDDLARLFTEFTRVESAASRQREGTGLGLALARRLVELHGGTLTAESAPGVGSTFTATLPLAI